MPTPEGVERVDVISALEMLDAVKVGLEDSDALVMCAAVADWRPKNCAKEKLKKGAMAGLLELVRNPDVLKGSKIPRKIGFAAETGDPVAEALRKCREKGLEFCVANDVTAPGAGFGANTNRVVFVRPDGSHERLPKMSKLAVARRIISELK